MSSYSSLSCAEVSLVLSGLCVRAHAHPFPLHTHSLPSATSSPLHILASASAHSCFCICPFLLLLLSAHILRLKPRCRTTGEIFPSAQWLFLFRQPHEVLASACPGPAIGCHLGALGGQPVTQADVFKCAFSTPELSPSHVASHIFSFCFTSTSQVP